MDRSLDEFVGRETADEGDPEGASSETTDRTGENDGAESAATRDATDGNARGEDTTDGDAADEITTDGDTTSGDTTDGDGPSLAVGPAESTMAWTPGEAPCGSCGAAVERRWRDDGTLVCHDCKRW